MVCLRKENSLLNGRFDNLILVFDITKTWVGGVFSRKCEIVRYKYIILCWLSNIW